jgi:hypothetical protein
MAAGGHRLLSSFEFGLKYMGNQRNTGIMKRISLLALLWVCTWMGIEAQTIQVKISLNVNLMQNPDCWLNQGVVNNSKVYIHSGLCTSDAQQCFDSICASGPNSPWETVVGNWGLDDNVGLMTFEGNNVWSITIIPTTYYNTPGATPYTIGMVFRNDDGTFTGKDNTCNDIFVKGLNTTTPTVVDCNNEPYNAVTVQRTVLTGVKEASYLGGLVMSPNPFRDRINIDYNLQKQASQFVVKVYNATGQEVATLVNGSQNPGSHRLAWNGQDAAGMMVENGLYYMVMRDGDVMIAAEKMLLMR